MIRAVGLFLGDCFLASSRTFDPANWSWATVWSRPPLSQPWGGSLLFGAFSSMEGALVAIAPVTVHGQAPCCPPSTTAGAVAAAAAPKASLPAEGYQHIAYGTFNSTSWPPQPRFSHRRNVRALALSSVPTLRATKAASLSPVKRSYGHCGH